MRYLAALLFASAAIDWPGWWLDRAGVAALALGCLALALPPRARRIRRMPALAVPPKVVRVDDELETEARTVAERVGDYLVASGRTV